MTTATDLYFTKIKLKFKFCLIILYGSGCCGNSDGVTICSFGGKYMMLKTFWMKN
jgi:hypothetical protein